MSEFNASVEQLRAVLENLRSPWELDGHPWTESRLINVQQGVSQGEALAWVIRQIFKVMIPAQPPRKGKRLDTRWGAFGILASKFFAPVEFGLPVPNSQREAWMGIDQAILLYVFGAEVEVTEEQRNRYCLVGNEPEIAPNSTLSGWNRKGLEALLKLVIQYEEGLEAGINVFQLEEYQKAQPDALITESSIDNEIIPISGPSDVPPVVTKKRSRIRVGPIISIAIILLLVGFASWAGWKGYEIYQQLMVVLLDVTEIKPYLSPNPQVGQVPEVTTKVTVLRGDLQKLQNMVTPYMWLTPYLQWVPVYGGDISQAPQLIDLASGLVAAADEGLQAISPVVGTVLNKEEPLDLLVVLNQLQAGQPKLLAAQLALAQAQEARKKIDPEALSVRTRTLITEQIDPLLNAVEGKFRMEDALLLVKAAPNLLGVGKAGPKTYLLLIQNEDELRPTGGFITAVGSIVIKDGKLWDINVESSDVVDDFSKPYPVAPRQLIDIMNLPILAFRDSNWFSDYPTTAVMAEYLYSYARAHSVDGVIAINQTVVVDLLKVLGPVRIQGVTFEISSENVMQFMRSAKQQAPPGVVGVWDRKKFIGRLAQPLLEKILAARGEALNSLSQTIISLLDQRFILVQLDDPDLSEFFAKRNWDGAIRPPANSDFLMVVDSNVGYNKTNAVMETSVDYEIDLRNPEKPTGKLTVSQKNNASGSAPCIVFPPRENQEVLYSINECYWSYLRVYTPDGIKLTGSSPHAVLAPESLTDTPFPARVDDLGSEDILGAQVFGTFLVIPQRKTIQTGFQFELPSSVLEKVEPGKWIYRLTIQRQAGTKPLPLSLRVLLPAGAKLLSSTEGFSVAQDFWIYTADITQDAVIEISFSQ